MSLQVWLPLNGDLHNQGLSNITVTNNGAIVDNNGKIGKCYSFDGSNSCIELNAPSLYNIIKGGNQPFTIMFWIYHAAASRGIIFGDYGLTGAIQCNVELQSNHRVRLYWAGAPDKNFSTSVGENTWCHIALVYDGSQVIIYKNGVLQIGDSYSGTLTAKSKTTGVYHLGRDYRNDTNLNGKLNDFRIYDHALSVKEIEEIAKGLVLHYKLDNGGMGSPNLAKNSNTDSTSSNVWTLSMATGGTTKTIITDNGVHCVQITRNDTAQSGWRFMGYNNFDRTAIKTDTYYTASFDIKSNYAGTVTFTGLANSNATNYMTGSDRIVNCNTVYANEWSHISLAIKTISSFDNITVGSQIIYFAPSDGIYTTGNVILLKNIKLEEGKIDTYWIPNKSDALYSLYAVNDTIVYDSSGYGNNGTIIGSLETVSDSSRYSCATKFDGTSSAIKVTNNSVMAQGASAMTINLWAKASTWPTTGRLFSCTESGGFNLEGGNSGYWRFPIRVYTNAEQTSTAYKYDSKEIQISALPTNEWVMLTCVYDVTGTKTYINGELHHTYSNVSYGIYFNTNARLFLGCEANTANPSAPYYNGQMSDFRLYYTVLTSEQIKELYNTSMSIDNNGNIYARELIVEDTNNISTNKRGQLLVNTAEEDAIIASFIKPNKIECDNFYEY